MKADWPIEAIGHDDIECSKRLFEIDAGVLRTRADFVPIMMTTDRVVARSDCLFYAVQPADSGRSPDAERHFHA